MAFLDQWIWLVLLVPLVGVSGWVNAWGRPEMRNTGELPCEPRGESSLLRSTAISELPAKAPGQDCFVICPNC